MMFNSVAERGTENICYKRKCEFSKILLNARTFQKWQHFSLTMKIVSFSSGNLLIDTQLVTHSFDEFLIYVNLAEKCSLWPEFSENLQLLSNKLPHENRIPCKPIMIRTLTRFLSSFLFKFMARAWFAAPNHS